MQLSIFRTLWGYAGTPERLAAELAGSKYAGIEAELAADRDRQARLAAACEAAGLELISLIQVAGETPAEQLGDFRQRVGQAMALRPRVIVVHSGRDAWPVAQSLDFYARILELEAELGCRVAHETHRGRPFGTPWVTMEVLDRHPELRLCCDFSHWVLVCERFLPDLQEAVSLAASRALHLHARVGSDQAPQVEDPAAPAASEALATFGGWWRTVWERQRDAAVEVSTVTPEYGPPPYQPGAGDPEAMSRRLASICDWQADWLRGAFYPRPSLRTDQTD